MRACGHGGVDAESPGFIAASRHHSPTAVATYDQWLTPQGRVLQAFYGDEEGIKIQMKYGPVKHIQFLFRGNRDTNV